MLRKTPPLCRGGNQGSEKPKAPNKAELGPENIAFLASCLAPGVVVVGCRGGGGRVSQGTIAASLVKIIIFGLELRSKILPLARELFQPLLPNSARAGLDVEESRAFLL